jgi:hypothetical protein
MANSSEISDRRDPCLKACQEEADHCYMVTDYLTSLVCSQNFLECADRCDVKE